MVGDSVAAVFTFAEPDSTVAFCTVVKNEVVEADGTTASSKL